MQGKINRLLFDIKNMDEAYYKKVAALKERLQRKKKYLIIDIKNMEAQVDPSKVEPLNPLDRVEVEA